MRVHHVALRTRDLARAERFWVEVVGLGLRRRDGERAVWLGLDDAVLMLERAAPDEPAIPPGSMDFLALRTDATGRAGFERRCAAAGVSLEARTAHTSYVRDPDGRRVGVSTHPLDGLP